jgi:prephenate dehydratase
MIIGILGPEGTFSEKAAKKWNSNADLRYYDDVSEVARAAAFEDVDYSILPIENSLEGSIGTTLDALLHFVDSLQIIGEVIVPIRHCLLAKGDISDIKVVLSHPQALAQCRHFIKTRLRNVGIRATGSTAHAARLASKSREIAAIASETSAKRYNLKVLLREVQDRKENYTRFAVTGKAMPKPTGNDKTSIVVYLRKDRPGALHEILGEFASRNINLTKIESRPTKKNLGDYLFYIDLEGHITNKKIKEAIDAVEKKAGMLKILGSYPKASQ